MMKKYLDPSGIRTQRVPPVASSLIPHTIIFILSRNMCSSYCCRCKFKRALTPCRLVKSQGRFGEKLILILLANIYFSLTVQTLKMEAGSSHIASLSCYQLQAGFTFFLIGHEDPYGEQRYDSTVSRTSALQMVVEGSASRLGLLYPGERLCTHCTGGWVGPRAGLDRCGKSRPHRDLIPISSNPQSVAIPTDLSGSIVTNCNGIKSHQMGFQSWRTSNFHKNKLVSTFSLKYSNAEQ